MEQHINIHTFWHRILFGEQCRDEVEPKWTANDTETINLTHKLCYLTLSNIDRIRFELEFQAFVRRGGGKSGFSFFPQLIDFNPTLFANNPEMMSNESYALLENNQAIGENAALNNSTIYTARQHSRRSRSADARRSRSAIDAGEIDSDGDNDRNDGGDRDDVNDGGDGDDGNYGGDGDG